MQTQNSTVAGKQGRGELKHRDANPMVLLLLVIGFVVVSWGVVIFSSHVENSRQTKTHVGVKSLPPIFRQ